MDLGLSGRTALVLGAGGGLGRAISVALAREGARVAAADVDDAALDATAAAGTAAGGTALPLLWDIADLAVIEARFAAIEAALGPVAVLVTNPAGPPPTPASGVEAAVWQAQFQAMAVSVMKITDRALPAMRSAGWGRVVTSASSGVVAPIPGLAISNALRLALVGWSKSLAREEAAAGITVNIVLPGRVATDRIHFLDEAKAKREGRPVAEVVAESTASIPAKRYGTPEEYGDVVAFLASARASYVTGSVVRVDGGYVPSL